MSKKKPDFTQCPCCGVEKYGLLQDKVHLDWTRECLSCGYAIELIPRANTRNSIFGKMNKNYDNGEFESLKAGLTIGRSLEDLFETLPT